MLPCRQPPVAQYICRAPETLMVAPDTNLACCDARNTTTGAISEGSAMRPSGVSLVIDSRTAGSISVSSIDVDAWPGETTLTVIWWGP